MKTFEAAGRPWEVVLNVAQVGRVRDTLGINLLDLAAAEAMLGDPLAACNVLYVLCRGQAEAAGVSDVQFGEGLAGDTLLAALEALRAELVNFIPRPSSRAALAAVFAKGDQVAEQLAATVQQRLTLLDPRALADSLLTKSSGSSGNSPGPSVLTPAP